MTMYQPFEHGAVEVLSPRHHEMTLRRRVDTSTRSETFSALAKTVMIVPALFVLLEAIFSKSAVVLMTSVIAFAPLAISVHYIHRLSEYQLPKSFLIEQVFFGAIPGHIAGAFTTALLTACTLLAVFHAHAAGLRPLVQDLLTVHDARTALARAAALGAYLRAHVAPWRVAAAALLIAFAARAAVQEFVKLAVATRVRPLLPGGMRDCNLSARSVAAATVAGALGVAAIEHFATTFRLMLYAAASARPQDAYIVAAAVSFLLAAVTYPIHLATALIMGSAMARRLVRGHRTSILAGYVVAVFFAGSFNALVLYGGALFMLRQMSVLVAVGFAAVELLLSAALTYACQTSLKLLEDRKYELLDSGTSDV